MATHILSLFLLLVFTIPVLTIQQECNISQLETVIPNAAYAPNVCGKAFISPSDLNYGQPRSLFVTIDGYVLGIERKDNEGRIMYYPDKNHDGQAESPVIISVAPNLNHGLAVFGNYIYASSDTTVYRWLYETNSKEQGVVSQEQKEGQVVIYNINADGKGGAPLGHTTRTLAFDKNGTLYVSVGSAGNVDSDSHRSRIRRFFLEDESIFPIDFQTGFVFADGLRNEVGLAFDSHEILWGVENSADRLRHASLGGDIHNDNPADELNRFPPEDIGKSWGYPYCWTEYYLPQGVGAGKGAVWGWPNAFDSPLEGMTLDAWCRAYTVKSTLALQAHSAPLGITFFQFNENLPDFCDKSQSFPKEWDGHAFMSYHGSWNRDVPTGYKVVRLPMKDGMPEFDNEAPIDIMWHAGEGAKWPNQIRPVDVKFDKCNRLLVSSDGDSRTGEGRIIITLFYLNPQSNETENTLNATFLSIPTCKSCTSDAHQILHFDIWNFIFFAGVQILSFII